jgi:hypothetical protein
MTETRASGDATADADVDETIPSPEADGEAVLAAVLKSEEDWDGGKHGELVLVRPSIGDTQDAQKWYIREITALKSQGIPSQQRLMKELDSEGIYTAKDEEQVRLLQQELSGLNVQLAHARKSGDEIAVGTIGDEIRSRQRKIEYITTPLSNAMDSSAENFADTERWMFLASRCVLSKATRMPLWLNVDDLKAAKEDQDTLGVLAAFMRFRRGLPLRPSAASPAETVTPADSGANSGA